MTKPFVISNTFMWLITIISLVSEELRSFVMLMDNQTLSVHRGPSQSQRRHGQKGRETVSSLRKATERSLLLLPALPQVGHNTGQSDASVSRWGRLGPSLIVLGELLSLVAGTWGDLLTSP